MRPKRRTQLQQKASSSQNGYQRNRSRSDNKEIRDIVVKIEPTYVFIELKLLSIDPKCWNFKPLLHKFLCVSSNCCASQIKKFLRDKMELLNDFEVVLLHDEFEVENICPMIFIRNSYFSDEEKIVLHYAIVEKKQQMSASDTDQS